MYGEHGARVPSWKEVVAAAPVATVTTQLECARRTDGGAAVIVCSDRFLARWPQLTDRAVSIDGACLEGKCFQDATRLSGILKCSIVDRAGLRRVGNISHALLLCVPCSVWMPLLPIEACKMGFARYLVTMR